MCILLKSGFFDHSFEWIEYNLCRCVALYEQQLAIKEYKKWIRMSKLFVRIVKDCDNERIAVMNELLKKSNLLDLIK